MTEEKQSIIIISKGESLNLEATELRLGPPGSESDQDCVGGFVKGAKRGFSDVNREKWAPQRSDVSMAMMKNKGHTASAAAAIDASNSKAQVVGWPPIRSFRKNTMATISPKNNGEASQKLDAECLYVKVSMDGAPYLRKVDLNTYRGYAELSSALEKMFSCFTIGKAHLGQYGYNGVPGRDGLSLSGSRLKDLPHGSQQCVLTYEDKDGDWMLVGDVPWDMFTNSCKRIRITKSSEAIGSAPRAMEKCKNDD